MPVYIIRAGETEMVKIGWTGGNVESRRRIFQSGHIDKVRSYIASASSQAAA